MTQIIKADGSSIEFTCPQCGSHDLEEVQEEVTLSTEIESIGDGGDMNYGSNLVEEDGQVIAYQCKHCKWEIPGITTCDGLYTYLVEQSEKDTEIDPDQSDEDYVKSKYPNARLEYETEHGDIEVRVPDLQNLLLGCGETEEEAWENACLFVQNAS